MTDESAEEVIPECVVTHRMVPGDLAAFRQRDLQGRLADAMASVRYEPPPPLWSGAILTSSTFRKRRK